MKTKTAGPATRTRPATHQKEPLRNGSLIIAPTAPATADSWAVNAVLHGHALVVRTVDPHDRPVRVRRRIYLSLPAAEKAAETARAQGKDVQIVLVGLVPVGVES